MSRTIPFLAFALAASCAPLTHAADSPTPAARPSLAALYGDELLAQGRGVKVTSSQLEAAFLSYKANLAARGERISEAGRTLHEAQLLDRLIVTQILTNRASAADLTNAAALEQKFLAEAKRTSTSDDAFRRQLKAMSMTPEQFQQRIHDQAVAEAVIERELKSTLPVSDDDAREFHRDGVDVIVRAMRAELDRLAAEPASKPADIAVLRQRIDIVRSNNLARLEQPERVRLLHIFLATRERTAESELPPEQKKRKRADLEKLRTRALAGEDFAKLVLEFSEDRGLPETKGEYTFGRLDPFAPEFKSAAFSLEAGKISDIVDTTHGFHLLKLLEKIPAQKTDFDKAAKDIRELLQQQTLQKALPDYFTRLKKESAVEILEPKYRIELRDQPALRSP